MNSSFSAKQRWVIQACTLFCLEIRFVEGTNSNEKSGHVNKASRSSNVWLLWHNIQQILYISVYFVTHRQQATGWSTKESVFDFRQRQDIFVFSINCRPALGTTQALIQWVPGTVFLGQNSRKVELTIFLLLLLKSSPFVFMACARLIKTMNSFTFWPADLYILGHACRDKKTWEHLGPNQTKLRGLSPPMNYTNRATAACRRS
jgi:hypothetical protein